MSRWSLPRFAVGELAPAVAARSRSGPDFRLGAAAGRYVLIVFPPSDPAGRSAAIQAYVAVEPALFDARHACALFVAPEPPEASAAQDRLPAMRWLFDTEGALRRAFGASAERPEWLLFDPMLRLMARAPIDRPEAVFDVLRTAAPLDEAQPRLTAPVLTAPRVFDPGLCRRLIAGYEAGGAQHSGLVADAGLRSELNGLIGRNLVPLVARAFQFHATRLERYLVACQEADGASPDDEILDGGYRRFAVSINLNDDFEGGDLRFPEFGPETYRAPLGGALVFTCNLRHEATMVTQGRRYAFLPFLYDEEGQRAREQDLARARAQQSTSPETR